MHAPILLRITWKWRLSNALGRHSCGGTPRGRRPQKRGMERLILVGLCLAVWSSVAWAQVPTVGIFTDSLGIDCNLIDSAPGLLDAHVVVIGMPGVSGVQFAAPKPACFTGTWLADTAAFPVTIGSSQTGVSIGLGTCLPSPVRVLTMW